MTLNKFQTTEGTKYNDFANEKLPKISFHQFHLRHKSKNSKNLPEIFKLKSTPGHPQQDTFINSFCAIE